MDRIIGVLLYGGLSKESYRMVQEDCNASNRKSIILISCISGLLVTILAILTFIHPEAIYGKNRFVYIFAGIFFLTMALLNHYISNKNTLVLNISKYIFISLMFAIGIVMAVTNSEHLTVSYIIFLLVVPLLLLLRPLNLYIVLIITNIVYLIVMYKIQTPELFSMNLVNAIVYFCVSVVVNTSTLMMKLQKYESECINNKMMRTDMLTNLGNRQAYMELEKSYTTKLLEPDLIYASFDVNGLKKINDSNGHSEGDRLLITAAKLLEKVFGEYGNLYRTGGDEFVAVLHLSEIHMKSAVDRLNNEIANCKDMEPGVLAVSVGYASVNDLEEVSFSEIAQLADKRMYEDKNAYYIKTGRDRRK